MNVRLAPLAASLLVLVVSASPAEAQLLRLFRDRDSRDSKSSSRPIPAHEDAKRSAEQAYQSGEYDKAINLMNRVLAENPKDHIAYYLRGSARVELGLRQGDRKLIREGIGDAREAIRIEPENSAMYYLPYLYGMKSLATLENRKEHAEIAVTVAGQALSIPNLKGEEKANLLYQRALSEAWLKKYDEAIADLQQAVQILPNHLGAHAMLAETYAAAGKTEEALASYTKAVELFPNNPLVFNNRGMFLQQQGRVTEAITDFTRTLEVDPNYFYAYTNRGFALLQSDNPQAAEADFNASLRLSADQPFVYNLRGQARLAQENVDGAIADQQRVVQLRPQDASSHSDLGFTYFFTEDFAQALASFDKAVQLDAQMRYLDPWRYWSLVAQDRAEEAKTRFAASLNKEADKRDWIDRLLVYLSGGLSEEDLLKSVDKSSEQVTTGQTCEAHFFIGLREAKEGNAQQAAEHFQKAVDTGANHLSAFRAARRVVKKLSTPEADAAKAPGTGN